MENVYTIIKPFYILAKVIGLFPLSFDGPMYKGIFKTKFYDVLIPVIVPGMSISLIALNIIINEGPASSSAMLADVWKIHTVFGCFLVILQFVVQMNNYKSIPKFLEVLNNYDLKVRDFIFYCFSFSC